MNASVRAIGTISALAALLSTGCGNGAGRAAATTTALATTTPGSTTPASTTPASTTPASTTPASTTPASDRQADATTAPSPSTGCSNDEKKNTVAYDTIKGVAANSLSLDIYTVRGACNAPVWMWVHGGGYRIGDKANQVADKVALARKHGWIFVSINYRLSTGGAGSDGPNDAQYPDHFTDVAAAVGWVHDNIADYGGDPRSLALFGHSAGADIVSNVAINPVYLAKHGMKPTDLGCAAPLDTAGFDKANARPAERDNWEVALSNNPTYEADTSATLLISSDTPLPPILGVTRGAAGRVAIERAFLAAVTAAGWSATTIDAKSLSHSQVNTNIGAPGDTVMTGPVTTFLVDCLDGA